MDLSILIVNWNSAEFLRQCIRSIRKATPRVAYEIIVVDNGSFDGSDKMMDEEFPEVVYVQSAKNVGFSRANNLGVERARGQNLLFLNPDTEIIGPAIVALYEALQRLPDAGAVGAKLLNHDGTVQTSCIQSYPTVINQAIDFESLRKRWPKWGLWGMKPLFEPGCRTSEVEVISGACLMVRRIDFERVGGFSVDYFMYAEDADLCLKLSRAGRKNYFVPEATVTHFGGGSSRKETSDFSAMMMRESIWRYLRKTRGGVHAFGYRGCMMLSACCRLVVLGIFTLFHKLGRRQPAWNGSFRKWLAVLRWSVWRENLALCRIIEEPR